MTKLPKFEGRPLVEIPEVIPVANHLTGDFGRTALQEYQGLAKSDYNGNSNLDVLFYEAEIVKGSNPFAAVLMNQVLQQEGIRVATPADLERVLRTNALGLRGTYEDSALVLRSNEDSYQPNDALAKDLHKQVKAKSEKGKVQYPIMIPLVGLGLIEDQDSSYGLSFKLREDAKVIQAPQLAHTNNYKKFSQTDEQGLPIFDQEGSRTSYTRESGLSRLYLYRVLLLGSGGYALGSSDADGRVVAVRGEATQKKF